MTRLAFDAVMAPPIDLDGVTTGWRLVGSTTEPTVTTGVSGSAQAFVGSSAYEGQDAGGALLGLKSLTIRLLLRPDFDALAGTTATLVARGKGGPTAAEGWPFDLRLAVAGDALSATLQLAWTDETVAPVVHDLATILRPAAGTWSVLAVTREVTAAGTLLRASVNGVPGSEVTVTDQVPGTPGMPLTLGCRRNGSSYEQFYIGELEVVELSELATSPEVERLFASAMLHMPGASLDTVREYWFHTPALKLRESNYESYRLRPLAAQVSDADLAIDLRQRHGLPNTAIGSRLEAWEAALGLGSPAGLSLAERQERASGALVLVEGISAAFLAEYATRTLGTADPRTVFETVTRLRPALLWLGTATDLVTGSVLTPAGVAYAATDTANTALSCPWGRRALALGLGLDNDWTMANATLGNVTNTEPVAILLGYTLRNFAPSTSHVLAGNRETASLNGWEIGVTNTGTLRVLLDNGPNQAFVDLGAPSVSLNVPHYVMLSFDGSTLTGATELASGTAAFAFNPTSATPAALGAYRATTPENTANWDCSLFALARGAEALAWAADAQDICTLLSAATVNGA